MQRLLIAAISAAFLASITAPVMALDDYPPCVKPGQDHCRASWRTTHRSIIPITITTARGRAKQGKKKP